MWHIMHVNTADNIWVDPDVSRSYSKRSQTLQQSLHNIASKPLEWHTVAHS